MNKNQRMELWGKFLAIRERVEKNTRRKSAWNRGVNEYAFELLDQMEEAIADGVYDIDDLRSPSIVSKMMLNGADNWHEYSWGGCALIYDSDIAERLCNPTELKKTRNGERRPNASEEWLDTQARALFQAASKVATAIQSLM